MKIKIPGLNSLTEQSFGFRGAYNTRSDTPAERHPFKGELILGPDIPPSPRFLLADDLEKIHTPGITPAQARVIREMIVADAKGLAATMLPDQVSIKLGITSDLPPQEIEHTPSIQEVYLLAEAYDATKDETLDDALAYIFETSPPAHSEPLIAAHEKATAEGTPIVSAYAEIMAKIHAAHDRPKSAEQLQFVLDMREATPPDKRNVEWDALVEKNERD